PAADGLRKTLMNNLGNALAYVASGSISRVTLGQRDRAPLLRSLDLQSEALEKMGSDPQLRIEALLNIVQTYRELCDLGKDAAQEYLRCAAECLEAARAAMSELTEPPADIRAAFATAEASLALEREFPEQELARISEGLRRLLASATELSQAKLVAVVSANAFRIERRLGRHARAYRRLLCGLRAVLQGNWRDIA